MCYCLLPRFNTDVVVRLLTSLSLGDVRYPLPKPCNSDYSDVCPATKRSSLCNHRSYSRVCCKTCEHYLRSHSLSAQISSGYLNSTASDEQSPSDVSEDSVVIVFK